MKFQITCAHCGTRFLVEGKGGQTIECHCPGCDGTMKVTLPKVHKDDEASKNDDSEYQMGAVPQQDNGYDGGDNGDDNRQRKRRLALGCLFGLLVVAAAAVAFVALNHTVKKPIEDPYEYVEPDTAAVDTMQQEEPENEDTVVVHEVDSVPHHERRDTVEHIATEAAPEDEGVADEGEPGATVSHSSEPAKDNAGGSEQSSRSKSSKTDSKTSKSDAASN